jgi:hypothetical protein
MGRVLVRSTRRAAVARTVCAALLVAAVTVGCSDDDAPEDAAATTTTVTAPRATPIAAADAAQLATDVGDGSCDEIDTTRCLLPFPSNRFTEAADSTDTKLRVHLPEGQLANTSGSTLDVTEWNRNDGFSPGTPMLVSAPDVDLAASEAPPIGDIGQSMEESSPTIVIDLDTGERLAHWVELDSNAPAGQQLLIVRPAAALPEGHRIGVVLGALVDSSGTPLEASLGFRVYRDHLTTELDIVEERRPDMEELFEAAAGLGADRSTLYAAWDFTVASERNLSERLLTMRDDAFERLGTAAPRFTVNEVVTDDLPDGIGRRVIGTFDVPSYLTGAAEPGSRLTGAEDDSVPSYAGYDYAANFTCQIPTVALDGAGGTTRPVVYGHGLLGSAGEAENSQVAKIASTNDMMYCATDWIGMSEGDVGNAVAILNDLSKFPSLPDRSQQGILNSLFLARLMKADGGFSSHEAFLNTGGTSIIDRAEVYYDGNSQGGIMGGAATAVSTEWTKAVLGVPGMDYALLLSRSVDFNTYFQVLRGAYPDHIDQAIIYPLLSMLWDRGEANGYAQHMTADPYDGTPNHQVLLHVGFGDHQVATVAAEMEARTIGAVVRGPALADGRHPDAKPFYGLQVQTEFPTDKSVLVYWDSGTLPPPPGNITPAASPEFAAACSTLSEDDRERDTECADSHEDPRRAPESILQKDLFLRPDGRIEDTCNAQPCTAVHRKLLDY